MEKRKDIKCYDVRTMMNGFLNIMILNGLIVLGNLPAGIGSSNYDRRG